MAVASTSSVNGGCSHTGWILEEKFTVYIGVWNRVPRPYRTVVILETRRVRVEPGSRPSSANWRWSPCSN